MLALEPLNERMLDSLITNDRTDLEYEIHSDHMVPLRQNCVSGGVQLIFDRFPKFESRLNTIGANCDEWPDPPDWDLAFRVRGVAIPTWKGC